MGLIIRIAVSLFATQAFLHDFGHSVADGRADLLDEPFFQGQSQARLSRECIRIVGRLAMQILPHQAGE